MKTCPNCGELIGDTAEVCFNCNYNFFYKSVMSREVIQKEKEQAEKETAELNKKNENENKKLKMLLKIVKLLKKI